MLRIRSLALPFCCSAVPESCMHTVGPSAVGACSEPRHPTLSSTIGSLSPLRPSHATLSYAFKGTSSSAHIFQPSRHPTLPDTLSVGSASRRAFLLASIFVVVVSSFLHLLILILLPLPTFLSGFCLSAPSRFHCRTTSSAPLVRLLSCTYTCINSASLSLSLERPPSTLTTSFVHLHAHRHLSPSFRITSLRRGFQSLPHATGSTSFHTFRLRHTPPRIILAS